MNPAPGRPAPSPLVRGLLTAAGFVCVGLGLLGIFLPLLPTTPFLLLAAACFARSSPRFHAWLLANRTFGPLIHQWEKNRTISRKTKWSAIVLMIATLGVSIAFLGTTVWIKGLLVLLGLGLAIWLWRIPSSSPDAPEKRGEPSP